MVIIYYSKIDNINMDLWQKIHIIETLKSMNHTVYFVNYAENSISNNSTSIIRELLLKNNIDLFITPLAERELDVEVLKLCSKLNIKKFLICFDNLTSPFKYLSILKYFNLVQITSEENLKLFSRNITKSTKLLYMPYAFNTKINSLVIKEDDHLISRIVFIGTPYGSRVNLINFLLKNSIPITIYANKISNLSINNFKTFNFINFIKLLTINVGRKIILAKLLQLFNRNSSLNYLSPYLEIKNDVIFDSLNNFYSKYKLCLAFSEARNTGVLNKPVDIINLRSFEIPGSGGIQIIRYTDELNRFFKNYNNIVMYKNKEELLRISKLFLFEKTIQELNQLRIASFDNIKENHTWEARFKKAFYLLGLLGK